MKENYPRKKVNLRDDYYLKAYGDIKRYMLKNGFKWDLQSVYESKAPMSLPALIDFMETMSRKMPWLTISANDIIASDVISKKYNIKKLLQNTASRNRNEIEVLELEDSELRKPTINQMVSYAAQRSVAQESCAERIGKESLER